MRPDILRAERRNGRKHRRRHKKQKADYFFDNSHRRRIVKPAAVCYYGDYHKGNLNKSVLHCDRYAYFKNFTDYLLIWSYIGFCKRKSG